MSWEQIFCGMGPLVLALGILLNAFFITHTLSRKWVGSSPALIRGCASLVLLMWGATALFHLFSVLKIFHWVSILLLLSFGNFLLLWKKNSIAIFISECIRDGRRFFRFYQVLDRSSFRWMYRGILFGVLLLWIRMAIVPPLGWDGQTYHMVKAGMWVQNQGELPLKAPGGWSFHRDRLGGGEVFQAWALLLLHRDTFSCFLEFFAWMSLGVSFFALGKELGLRSRLALLASCYLLSLPIILLAVGSGYIELFLNVSFTLSFLFLIRFLNTKKASFLLLSFMSFGVALGIQLTPWPLFVFFVGFLLVVLWRFHSRSLWVAFCGGLFLTFLTVFPWNLKLWFETGYLFGHMEFRLGPLQLGKGTPELHWALTFPGLLAYDIRAELYTLLMFFRIPYEGDPHSYSTLSPFTIFPLFFFGLMYGSAVFSKRPFLLGLFFFLSVALINPWVLDWVIYRYSKQKIPLDGVFLRVFLVSFDLFMIFFLGYIFKKREFFMQTFLTQEKLIFLGGIALLTLGLFYHPQFSSRRLFWSGNCTRFLFPLIGLALLVSLSGCNRRSQYASIYGGLLWIGTCFHWVQCIFYGWARFEFFVIPGIALSVVGGGYFFKQKIQSFSIKTGCFLGFLFWVLGLSFLEEYRSSIRHEAVAQSSIYQFIPTYWTKAAKYLDQNVPLQIAITSNPNKFGDNWFLYFFLGEHLQNRLHYVPISYTGQILSFYEGFERNKSGHFLSWLQRIHEQQIQYVMSFAPTSVELEWMRIHPEWFEFILGDPQLWGVYRVKKR